MFSVQTCNVLGPNILTTSKKFRRPCSCSYAATLLLLHCRELLNTVLQRRSHGRGVWGGNYNHPKIYSLPHQKINYPVVTIDNFYYILIDIISTINWSN